MVHRINWRKVRTHFDYSIPELAKKLGVSRSTIRQWIKTGLPVVEGTRPILIEGKEFRKWYPHRLASQKRPCQPGEMHCFSCRKNRRPAFDEVEFHAFSTTQGNLRALCEECGSVMHQICGRTKISSRMPGIRVREIAPRTDIKS